MQPVRPTDRTVAGGSQLVVHRRMLLLTFLSCVRHCCADARAESGELVAEFVRRLRGSLAGDAALVVDVGANSGSFSERVLLRCAKEAPGKHVHLVMVEPQRRFGKVLHAIAKRHGGELVQAVAGQEDGSVHLYARYGGNSEAVTAGTPSSKITPGRVVGHAPSVNFARLLTSLIRERTPKGAALHVLLKLDVEGAEYSLLPILLGRGGLCRVNFLIIDWHLRELDYARRMGGFGLRHSLGLMLREACNRTEGGGPVAIAHEEYRPLTHVDVPGLADEAARHAALSNMTTEPSELYSLRGTLRSIMPQHGMRYELHVHKKSVAVRRRELKLQRGRAATGTGGEEKLLADEATIVEMVRREGRSARL